jgi:hypothetical protein
MPMSEAFRIYFLPFSLTTLSLSSTLHSVDDRKINMEQLVEWELACGTEVLGESQPLCPRNVFLHSAGRWTKPRNSVTRLGTLSDRARQSVLTRKIRSYSGLIFQELFMDDKFHTERQTVTATHIFTLHVYGIITTVRNSGHSISFVHTSCKA